MPSALDLLLSRLRRDLENAEGPLRSQLVLAYESAIYELEHDLFNVTWLIEDALSRGEDISPDWLYRQDRYQRLIVKAEAQMQRFAGEAMPIMERTFQSGTSLGTTHATPLLQAAGIRASFGTSINTRAVDNLYQMMFTQGSPLRDLLEGYGPHVGSVIRHEMGQSVIRGLSPREAVRNITQALASGENRARLTTLVRTEHMRSYRLASAEMLEEYAHAIKAYRWSAAHQPRTCLACLAMDGQEFDEPQHKMHPNCFPAGTLVNGPGVEAATKRWYVGELVEVSTAEGERLSVTPNHPILTTRGWIAAGRLQEGDYVVNYRGPKGPFAAINPDYENQPTLIEDVSESLLHELGAVVRSVPTTAEDFHGDGADGEVNVVYTDSLLGGTGDTPVTQPTLQKQLIGADVILTRFIGERSLHHFFQCVLASLRRFVGSGGQPLSFAGAGLGHSKIHRFGPIADMDAGLNEALTNRDSAGADLFSNSLLGHAALVPFDKLLSSDWEPSQTGLASSVATDSIPLGLRPHEPTLADLASQSDNPDMSALGGVLDRLPGEVKLDRVTELRVSDFSGHVYNLQTTEGWYIANNIISHNCRCICTPVGYYTPERYKRQSGAEWLAAQDEATQRGMFPSQAAYEAYKRGELPLDAFVGERHSDVWGTSITQLSGKQAMANAGVVPGGDGGPAIREFNTGDEIIEWADETATGWYQGLSEDEVIALEEYQADSHMPINSHLRKGEEIDPYDLNAIPNIDSAISKSTLPDGVVVYRGAGSGSLPSNLKTGDMFTDNGFVSTTMVKSEADVFLDRAFTGKREPALVKITVPPGHNGAFMDVVWEHGEWGDMDGREKEILLPRGIDFIVTGTSKERRTFRAWGRVHDVEIDVIELEILP